MNKKKDKDKLTHAQFAILRKQKKDAIATEKWIRSTGLNTETFNSINPKILQALQTAHALLTQHSTLLTTEQNKIIQNFIYKANTCRWFFEPGVSRNNGDLVAGQGIICQVQPLVWRVIDKF